MRTIEETKEEIKKRIEAADMPGMRFEGRNCLGCFNSILEFINSDPPCQHTKLIYWNGRVLAPGDLPSVWYSLKNNNNTACDKYSFCPDCGEKLPEDGVKE